jgi:hypothetical protein
LAIPTLIQIQLNPILILPNSMVKLLMGSTTKWQTCYDEHNGLNQGRDRSGYGVFTSMFCYSKAQGERGVIDNPKKKSISHWSHDDEHPYLVSNKFRHVGNIISRKF